MSAGSGIGTRPAAGQVGDEARALLRGAVDLDCRCAPTGAGGLPTHREAAEEAAALGLAGLVFRDDGYGTEPFAALLSETRLAVEGQAVFGSVTLNGVSGGLNLHAAEHCLMLHGRVVVMPTTSAENHLRALRWPGRGAAKGHPVKALRAIDRLGRVLPEAREVIEVVAERDGVLDGGYLHVAEILPLFRAAAEMGLRRMVVSDPMRRNAAKPQDIAELVALGARIALPPDAAAMTPELLAELSGNAAGSLILGLGARAEGRGLLPRYAAALRFWGEAGLSPDAIRNGVTNVPATLLGLSQRADCKEPA
ncbi:hypothetical protein GLS40_11670 [Pseudooceanicola sp. 216_PA32_1]|uniref:Uncharacterized protein n=1 Tax=Pseudooceanicola pacificus TaxID=2676438 RepID=A0A844W4D1_9RHOB|nr:DUF6282 family protein [Pseudooceanicola pacificus]MWB78687.1 hypothetical protein [Pseudooceanicola pacificus]